MTGDRQLDVLANQRHVGRLTERDDLWRFEYSTEWMRHAKGFHLSPALPRTQPVHRDGSSHRPVQWFFDNLLPEEHLRSVLAKEADVAADDAFGLLAHYGAESAGALELRSPEAPTAPEHGLRPLSLEGLSKRISGLPRVSLARDAPKRMSLAGAQHKLLVVRRGDMLYEPLSGTASTHILKPNHPDESYPASVVNEAFTMQLAQALKLSVPTVRRYYVPQPVYEIERFDRVTPADGGEPERMHVIDACQLLNKSRTFKYTASKLETLAQAVELCRSRAAARLQVYRWLLFCLLVGNGDNHLKNLSFVVHSSGIELAPAYDLLSTAVYDTRAFANEAARWPETQMTCFLGDAQTFAAVTRQHALDAGTALGLRESTARRELDALLKNVSPAADALVAKMDVEAAALANASRDPAAAHAFVAGERRLLRAVRHIILADMVERLAG